MRRTWLSRSSLILLTLSLVSAGPADPASAPATGGVFVAVGYGGRRIRSADGLHWDSDAQWSDKAADNDDVLFGVAFGKKTFVAVGGGAKIGHLLASADGKSWDEPQQEKGRVATIVFDGTRFIAGHDGEFLTSLDGRAWAHGAKLDFKGSMHFRRSACGNGVTVVIGDCDPSYKAPRVSCRCSTADGSSIASFDVDTPAARAIAFGAGRFVAVGPDGLRESSVDGKRWERRENVKGENLDSVVWTGTRFLAAGGGVAYSSPDGVAWTKESARIPCSLLWADESRHLFLGASWGGSLWHSTDGQKWERAEIKKDMPSFEAIGFGIPAKNGAHPPRKVSSD